MTLLHRCIRCIPHTGLLAGLVAVNGLAAQDEVRRGLDAASLDSLGQRIGTFSPRSGPPGTVVTFNADDMPIMAPLRVGVGAMRFGFEDVGWVLSSDEGEFTFEIVIPEWARHDMAHVFIVFDPYFAPIAISHVFHVTTPDGVIERRGRLSDNAGSCPLVQTADGERYALVSSDAAAFAAGAEVVVTGTLATSGSCGGDTTIAVRELRLSEPG